jgi:hypothetical protein
MGVAMGVATEVVALALLWAVEAAGEAQAPPSASHHRETWAAIRDLWAATARASECTHQGWAREPFNTNTGQYGNTVLAREPFNTNTEQSRSTVLAQASCSVGRFGNTRPRFTRTGGCTAFRANTTNDTGTGDAVMRTITADGGMPSPGGWRATATTITGLTFAATAGATTPPGITAAWLTMVSIEGRLGAFGSHQLRKRPRRKMDRAVKASAVA